MPDYISVQQGVTETMPTMSPIVMAYFTSILTPALGADLRLRDAGELKTLAMAMDLRLRGQIAEALDILMQRFRAVELSTAEGWGAAKHLTLRGEGRVSSIGQREREQIVSMERAELRAKSLMGKSPY